MPLQRAQTERRMQVPLLDLRLQYASIREDILSAVTRVCDSQQPTKNLDAFGDGAKAGMADRVHLPVEPAGRTHVYHQFVIRVPEREVVRAHLASRGIGCFTHLGYSPEAFPAEAAAGDGLALPIYPELTSDQQQHVIDSLAECVA